MIEKLQKKLIALFMGVSLLLFFAIFALLLLRDVQAARMSDWSLLQNHFASLVYHVESGKLPIHSEWEASGTIIRIIDDLGTVIWQCNGRFEMSEAELWDSFEKQLDRVNITTTGPAPSIIQGSAFAFAGNQGRLFLGNSAIIQTQAGDIRILEVMIPQTGVWAVIQQHVKGYVLLFIMIVFVLGLLSRFLVRQALKPAWHSLKSQKSFIAAASHELKAPLSVIQLHNEEAINLVGDDHKVNGLLVIALTECRRMSGLVSDLLALASSDAGNWTMKLEPLDMDSLLIETYEKHLPLASRRGIEVEAKLPRTSIPKITGDQERIAQVFDILMNNAFHYSPPNTTVTLQAEVQKKSVIISVIDHGEGISDADKPLIFDRFFRGDPSRTGKDQFGLGLSIAKEIVALHKGKIEVRDTPDGGSTFRITLIS